MPGPDHSDPTLYSVLSDDQLVAMLHLAEGRLSRRAVDEFLRRPGTVPPLAALASDEAAWRAPSPAQWAPIHATFILGAVGGAVRTLLRASSIAVRVGVTQVTESIDEILGAQGPQAWDPMLRFLASSDESDDAKAGVVSALGALVARFPSERERVRPLVLDLARDPFVRPPVRQAAAASLLRMRDPRDREFLAEWASSDSSLFGPDAVASAYATEEEPLRGSSWLSFYDEEAVRARSV